MPPFLKRLSIVALITFTTLLWIAGVMLVLPHLLSFSFFGAQYSTLGVFVFACVLAPLWEEAAFRHAPLQIAKSFKEKLGMDLIIPIVIISSVIFGLGHGNGSISLMVQGVGGVLLSLAYIWGGFNYWTSVAAHFMWNFSLIYLFPSFTATYGIQLWWQL